MPNILPVHKQLTVLKMLVEGNSISSTARLTGIHRDTITRLLVRFGKACKMFLDRELRDLEIDHLECDEIWTYCGKKQKRLTDEEKLTVTDKGDIYLYVALDENTRLVPSHHLGKRDEWNTVAFIKDLSNRLKRPRRNDTIITRISTDAWPSYPKAIALAFSSNVVYGQIKKRRENNIVVGVDKKAIYGSPAPDDISTSLVERNNLTTRTFIRRFARRTIAFSKKLENLQSAVTMHFTHYNYCWVLRGHKTTPAVSAGVVGRRWKFQELYDHVRDCAPEHFLEDVERDC